MMGTYYYYYSPYTLNFHFKKLKIKSQPGLMKYYINSQRLQEKRKSFSTNCMKPVIQNTNQHIRKREL